LADYLQNYAFSSYGSEKKEKSPLFYGL